MGLYASGSSSTSSSARTAGAGEFSAAGSSSPWTASGTGEKSGAAEEYPEAEALCGSLCPEGTADGFLTAEEDETLSEEGDRDALEGLVQLAAEYIAQRHPLLPHGNQPLNGPRLCCVIAHVLSRRVDCALVLSNLGSKLNHFRHHVLNARKG